MLVDPTQPGSSRLIIQSVNRSDAGLYTCSAANQAGLSSYNVTLVVHCTCLSSYTQLSAELSRAAVTKRLFKAKIHYASWFGACSELV